jgi:selenide, water dikinase
MCHYVQLLARRCNCQLLFAVAPVITDAFLCTRFEHTFTRSPTVMASHNSKVQTIFDRILRERGVELHLGSAACDIVESSSSSSDSNGCNGGGEVILESGAAVPYDEVIWCTGSGAAAWFAGTGLALTEDGFIKVTETLQVTA